MTDQTAAVAAPPPAKGRSPLIWIVLAVLVLLLAGGGAAGWYFMMVKPKQLAAENKKPEAPLPFTLPIKPFVISVPSGEGASHFVQLGANLELPSSSAGDMVTSVLPQIQDAIRETVLSFKSDDLQTADGINKMRAALLTHLNEALVRLVGGERISQWTGNEQTGLIKNIYFPTLVVE